MASLGWKTVADWVRAVWAFIKEHPWRFWVPLALAVVGGVLDGLVPTAHEIGRLLPYGAYVGVGVLSAAWFTLMVADWPFAVMWHLVDDYSTERALPRILALWNRQVGRLQAVATLATLVFIVWPSRFHLASFGFFLWLLLFGSKVVDAIVGHLVENPDDLSWARRVLLYGITLFGTGVLMAVAPHQIVAIMRFLLVAWVGLAIRIAYWLRGLVDRKLRFNQAPRRRDAALIALLLAGMAAPLVPIVNVHVTVGASDQAQRTSLVQSCGWTADGPGDPPDVSLFLVADSQFHTLYGARTQGHTELVDWLVPVAVRPIELDLLSFAPLRRFAGAYHALKESGRAKMKWAHLGDYGDLGCVPEIERFGAYAKLFGEDLAALSPGNHDSTYIGNFDWHPDWDRVCQRLGTKEPARRLDKGKADAMLLAAARPLIDPTATTVALVEHPVTSWTQVEKNALVWVSRLGESHGREVIGAFLDSSDFTTFALGAAGEQGSVSELQADWFIAQLGLHPRALVVLFMHHPLDEISILGRSRVERVAASLGPRLLAVVSAHTHLAAFRGHRLAGRAVPEFVIGFHHRSSRGGGAPRDRAQRSGRLLRARADPPLRDPRPARLPRRAPAPALRRGLPHGGRRAASERRVQARVRVVPAARHRPDPAPAAPGRPLPRAVRMPLPRGPLPRAPAGQGARRQRRLPHPRKNVHQSARGGGGDDLPGVGGVGAPGAQGRAEVQLRLGRGRGLRPEQPAGRPGRSRARRADGLRHRLRGRRCASARALRTLE